MNEVKTNQATAIAAAIVTSSQKADIASAKVVEAGKQLPPLTTEKQGKKVEESTASRAEVSKAVARMNEFVQNEQRNLRFSVDEGSGETVIRVTERESGELIRQIPNQIFLDMAANARKDDPIHLISVYG